MSPPEKTAAELARLELEQADRLAERSSGRDLAISVHLALGQAYATLAVAEQLERVVDALQPRYEVRHASELDPAAAAARVFPHGSAGLCMTYSSERGEHCTYPVEHTGDHSWAH